MRKKISKNSKRALVEKPHHHGDLKAALLKAAINYLKEGTAADLSLRDLARRAGVSQAAPYRHFKDKEDLIASVAAEGFRELAKHLKKAALVFDQDPAEQFYQAGLSYLRVGMLQPEHFKLMNESMITQDYYYAHPELYIEAQLSFYALVKVILNSQKHGLIGEGSPINRAMHCWMAVHGFTVLYLHGRITWLGVEGDQAESAMRGLLEELLHGMKRSQVQVPVLLTVCTKPTPSSVFVELGLKLEDFSEGTVELFDSSQPWPFPPLGKT